MASSVLPPHPVLSNKLPSILKDHTCISSITLEVSHLTRMSRSWMRLFDDEILAIWVGCSWKLYSTNPGGRGMGRPILRFRHSPTERSRCARTMGLHHPICGPASYKKSLISPLCPIFGSFLSFLTRNNGSSEKTKTSRPTSTLMTFASVGWQSIVRCQRSLFH